jgi:predicted AAA+ superfamily ATPase
MIKRIQKLDIPPSRSTLLWGSRKTGKTTLLRQQFPDACWIDFLNYDLFLSLSQKPAVLRQILKAQKSKTVIIDEAQKIPHLYG